MYNRISCGRIQDKDVGKVVSLSGWVQDIRRLGKLVFLNFRDYSGYIQIVLKKSSFAKNSLNHISELSRETVIYCEGIVKLRNELDNKNSENKQSYEISATKLRILNKASLPPLKIADDTDALEDVRFKFRYLDIRRKNIAVIFKLRHQIIFEIRNFFNKQEFLEIETPLLSRSTPEGARDYLVPTRRPHHYFALPQSPQLFKQLLMIGGFEKYFQIARCFRDEDSRSDRQPEFTQLDLEMSFVSIEEVIKIIEKLFIHVFKNTGIKSSPVFSRLTYKKAINEYGSDKPDLRWTQKIINLKSFFIESNSAFLHTNLASGRMIIGLPVKKLFTESQIKKYQREMRKTGLTKLLWIQFSENKEIVGNFAPHLTNQEKSALQKKFPNQTLFVCAGTDPSVLWTIGHLRQLIANELFADQLENYKFVWITDWPLFEQSSKEKLSSMHHPFTRPSPESLNLLATNPLSAMGMSYDLVLNGCEIGGGSLRIHDSELQRRIFKILGLEDKNIDDNFGFFLRALDSGAPPHGGFAMGLDRLIMILAGQRTIREVIAFPKNSHGQDLMLATPNKIVNLDDSQNKGGT